VLGVDAQRVASRLTEIAGRLDCSPGPTLSWGLSPHAPYTLTEATLVQVSAFAQQHRLPLAMHWAETAAELAFVTAGEGPIAERLYPTAGWPLPADPPSLESFGGLLVHGTHLDEAQIDGIARTGQSVVLCPRSNSLFGATRAPVAALRRAGVPLALGTDSRASSPSLSVWDELAFGRSWFTGAIDPQGWLELATAGGARALGLAGEMGRLAPGLAASFQVMAVPPGATAATLAEALCAEGHRTPPLSLILRGETSCPILDQPL
jgi:cytosine/adenosine deaminase-related metal-dependent hydrolase